MVFGGKTIPRQRVSDKAGAGFALSVMKARFKELLHIDSVPSRFGKGRDDGVLAQICRNSKSSAAAPHFTALPHFNQPSITLEGV
jgi:hypothetical protein